MNKACRYLPSAIGYLPSANRHLPHAVCLLAFALRLIHLNSRPLWYDEAFAVLFAAKGFRAMLAGTLTPVAGAAADVHPVAYYTLLNGWMQVFGPSPFVVRLLSVFAGLITVAVIYAVGQRLFGQRAGAVGMLVVAASPFQVYYAQEARMYAAMGLTCALVVLFFALAVQEEGNSGKWENWGGVAVSAAAAMYMHNLSAFFLLALGLSVLPRPKVFLKVAAAGAGAFVLWLPWFLNVPGQFAKLRQAYWVTRPDFVTLLQTALVYHGGEELAARGVGAALALALFTAILLPAILIFQLAKIRNDASARRAAWLFALAGGTPLLLFAASLYQPVYVQRALSPAALMYAAALGWLFAPGVEVANPVAGATRVAGTTRSYGIPGPVRVLLGAMLGLTMLAGLWAHYTFAQFPRPDFPAAVEFLKQKVATDDLILHSNKLTFFPMYYYDRTMPQAFLADPPGSGSDTLALPTQDVLGLHAVSDPETAARGAGRVWFVIFDKAIEEYRPDPHPHLAWLEAHYAVRSVRRVDDLVIYEFIKIPNPKSQTPNSRHVGRRAQLGSWEFGFGI